MQRVFTILFPALKKAFNVGCSPTIQRHYLLVLAGLLNHVTPQVLTREGDALLPLLRSSLVNTSSKIQEAAIKALKTLMGEGVIAASKLGLNPNYDGTCTLLELLLTLATVESDEGAMSSNTRKYSIPVRVGALQCLALVPKLLSASMISDNQNFDPVIIRRVISKSLAQSLDDPKRLVRAEAVKCHYQWLTASFTNK